MSDKKVYYYAQLNEDNICTVVGEYSCKMNDVSLIELEKVDTGLLGCRYDNGTWNVIEKEETEDVFSDEEIIRAEILLNQISIIAKQEEQDEVLAEILLNQMEG